MSFKLFFINLLILSFSFSALATTAPEKPENLPSTTKVFVQGFYNELTYIGNQYCEIVTSLDQLIFEKELKLSKKLCSNDGEFTGYEVTALNEKALVNYYSLFNAIVILRHLDPDDIMTYGLYEEITEMDLFIFKREVKRIYGNSREINYKIYEFELWARDLNDFYRIPETSN